MCMENLRGSSVNDVKLQNRRLVLCTIVERPMISRGEIAEATGLSKMSMSNIIGELMQAGIVCEPAQARRGVRLSGPPARIFGSGGCVSLRGRRLYFPPRRSGGGGRSAHARLLEPQRVLPGADGRAHIGRYDACAHPRGAGKLPASGVGDRHRHHRSGQHAAGTLLQPANFYGIHDVPIVRIVAEETGYPVFFTADSMAGAQGEKLFGEGRAHDNFLFLLLWEGIGCGVVIDGKLHAGEHGLGGELGHTSIRFDGPVCPCGSRGCLELYASTARMAEHVRARVEAGEPSLLKGAQLNWSTILNAAVAGDNAARSAVEEYCDYLSCALVNMVNVFDPEIIYICQYENPKAGELLAALLQERVRARMLAPDCRRMSVRCSTFGSRSVMTGALALVAGKVFDGTLPFMP